MKNGENGAECAQSCAAISCRRGERCVDGRCESDLCFEVTCLSGQVCRDGQCLRDPCAGVLCGPERRCLEGQCQDDPCSSSLCPYGQYCDSSSGQAECFFDDYTMTDNEAGSEGGADAGSENAGDQSESGSMIIDQGLAEQDEFIDQPTSGVEMTPLQDFGTLPIDPLDQGVIQGSKGADGCESVETQPANLLVLLLVVLVRLKRSQNDFTQRF